MESKTEYSFGDDELIFQVRENNEEAKDCIYEKYSPLIHKEINRVKRRAFALGVDAADLSQEAMLAFSHAINNFKEDEEAKFITFATLCIRRRLSNFIGKYDTNKSKIMATSIHLDESKYNNLSLLDQIEEIISTDPLNKMINYETLNEVKKAIEENLSDNERLALKYDTMGKSAKEIADIMGMSTKQIYNLIHRARTKLKP